jgi:hypothetical protein
MGSVYKELMRAAAEREAQKQRAGSSSAQKIAAEADPQGVEEEMLVLLESIESLVFQKRRKIIQFIGSQEGQRASTVARAYAKMSASVMDLSVLLMESTPCDSSLVRRLSRELEAQPGDSGDTARLKSLFQQMGESKFFVSPSANAALSSTEALDIHSTQLLWTLLKGEFDLIVIDSGPLRRSAGSPPDIARADGVVLVFESELPESDIICNMEDVGLASILDIVAKGGLSPMAVVTCLGAPLLLLTPTQQAFGS